MFEFDLFIYSSPNLRSSVLLFQSTHFIAEHSSHYEPRELHVSLDPALGSGHMEKMTLETHDLNGWILD